ncbi:2-Hydroxyacid oxidase 1-like [Amphiura filiformis]|uniref:2-Hydroxyacid oxidase 1-like n=1 Tax=Amphiura filiformis TaxID=82378 RepID=UPI003B220196
MAVALPVCVKDFEDFAQRNLPKYVYNYFAGGSSDEQTLQDNVKAYRRIWLKPRLMRDVSNRDLSTTILGQRIAFPIAISPTGVHCMAHPDGEIATARAAAALETGMAVSTYSTNKMEEVARSAPEGLRWLQINVFKDRELLKNFVKRAENLGFKALFLTMDKPVEGAGRYNVHGKFVLPAQYSLGNFQGLINVRSYAQTDKLRDKSATWDSVDWLRSITRLPIVAKGILTAEDAREAVKHGVSGILVSNHGGRGLDGVPATIDVLSEVVEAVKGSGVEVYVDGGIRMGTDVVKALALGAQAVFVGRAVIWGLAYDGENGVKKVLEILRDEFSIAMALSGCRSLDEISADLVEKRSAYSSKL